MSDKKFLTDAQLRNIEKRHYEEALAKEEIIKMKMRLDNCRTQLNLMSAQYTLKNKEISELEKELKELDSRLNGEKMKTKLVVQEITDELKLKQRWGFNPDTGEINE